MSVSASLGPLIYKSEDSGVGWVYKEDGKGTSLNVDLNFYPGKKSLSGFYISPGVGLTPISTNWSEVSTANSGSNTGTLFDLHAKVGWKIDAGSVVIDPNLRLGYFFNTPTGGTNRDPGLGIYILLGVNVGVPF